MLNEKFRKRNRKKHKEADDKRGTKCRTTAVRILTP